MPNSCAWLHVAHSDSMFIAAWHRWWLASPRKSNQEDLGPSTARARSVLMQCKARPAVRPPPQPAAPPRAAIDLPHAQYLPCLPICAAACSVRSPAPAAPSPRPSPPPRYLDAHGGRRRVHAALQRACKRRGARESLQQRRQQQRLASLRLPAAVEHVRGAPAHPAAAAAPAGAGGAGACGCTGKALPPPGLPSAAAGCFLLAALPGFLLDSFRRAVACQMPSICALHGQQPCRCRSVPAAERQQARLTPVAPLTHRLLPETSAS